MPISAIYKRDKYPFLTPNLTVKDPLASMSFYEEAFGFKPYGTPFFNDEKKIIQASMVKGEEVFIFIRPEGAYSHFYKSPKTLNIVIPVAFHVYVENVESIYNKAIKAGAMSFYEPQEGYWGDYFCKVGDLDGYEWMFVTYLRKEVTIA